MPNHPGDGGGGEHADQNGAADFFDFKRDHEDQAEERERCGGMADVAEADEGLWVADDKSCIAKTDEGDEEADAAGDGGVEFVRDGAKDHLPDAGGGERKKNDAGKKDRAQGRLPGDVHLEADGVGEVGVEAHARSERDGIARNNAHQDGTERSGETGGRGDGRQGHTRRRQEWPDSPGRCRPSSETS